MQISDSNVVRAGAAGALTLAAAQVIDIAVTKRQPSGAPVELVRNLTGWEPRGEAARTVVGYAAQSALPFAAAAILSAIDGGRARRFAGAWVIALFGGTVVDGGLGLVEPPWRWSAADWLRELALKGAMASGVSLGAGSQSAA